MTDRRSRGSESAPVAEAGSDADPRASRRMVWAVTLPILFAGITDTVIHVTDTAFLARVGTLELTALAFADTLFDVWTIAVIGLVGALQIIIARRVGEQRDDAVGPTFARGMVAVLLTALFLAAALKLAAPALSQLIVEGADVASEVNDFLQIAAYGIVFYSLTLGYVALYIGIGRTRVLISATIVLAGSNLVLSYALILGRLGFPAMGIRGAGWAFVAAELVTFLYLTATPTFRKAVRRYGGLRPAEGAASLPSARLLRLAAPISLEAALEALRWLAFFFILQQVSREAVAWSNILYACYGVLMIPATAFAETTDALVSNVIGRQRSDELVAFLLRVARAAYLATLPAVAVALIAPDLVVSIFTLDPAALEGASPSLRVIAVAMLLAVASQIWQSGVAGTGATDVAFAIELVSSVALLGCTYLAAVVLGASLGWVWASLIVAAVIGLAASHWWVRSRRWEERVV